MVREGEEFKTPTKLERSTCVFHLLTDQGGEQPSILNTSLMFFQSILRNKT